MNNCLKLLISFCFSLFFLQINKHIAKLDGTPIFSALWTCMDSRYIRAQALTLTKAHDERIGPLSGVAKSVQLYGHPNPRVAFSDDPIKVCSTPNLYVCTPGQTNCFFTG